MKTVSIFLALLNSLFAGFLILLDLSYNGLHPGSLGWSFLKLSAASSIILIGISAWMVEMGLLRPAPILLGGLFLIALGPATLVWAVHVALTTGHLEFHMVVYAVSLMAQGLASLLGSAAGNAGTVQA
jgi:hypothetical protein